MHAALVTGKRRIEQIEFPQPEPTPGRTVVDVRFCGICGTDLHAFESGGRYNPAICGHEWTGTVSAARGDDRWREGDRVAVGIATACGYCATCERGDAAHCETAFAGMIGIGPLAAPHGGFAPSIAIDSSRLYAVHSRLTDVEAALLEPATVALHAVRRTRIRLGDVVAVIGGGPIGLLTAQCARAAGAGEVWVIEPKPGRRDMATVLGADRVLASTAEAAEVATVVDVVFECAGVPETVDAAVSLVRRGGTVSLVGVATAPATINAASWLVKEVAVTASLGYLRSEFDICQGLVADGRLDVTSLHTSTANLGEIGPAFERLGTDADEIKILIEPG